MNEWLQWLGQEVHVKSRCRGKETLHSGVLLASGPEGDGWVVLCRAGWPVFFAGVLDVWLDEGS
jgi:hypothetical protein